MSSRAKTKVLGFVEWLFSSAFCAAERESSRLSVYLGIYSQICNQTILFLVCGCLFLKGNICMSSCLKMVFAIHLYSWF